MSQSLLRQRLSQDATWTPPNTARSHCLNRFFVSDYLRTNFRTNFSASFIASQSLLRQRLSQDIGSPGLTSRRRLRLNRFFVSDYLRTATKVSVTTIQRLVSIASSSATISGHHRRLLRFTHRQLSLNRFFVSDYLRTRVCPLSAPRPTRESQSLLRQRLSQDGFITSVLANLPFEVSIASSSATISGLAVTYCYCAKCGKVSIASSSATISGPRRQAGEIVGHFMSQSLLRQRLSQDPKLVRLAPMGLPRVSIASSSATISGLGSSSAAAEVDIASQSLLRQRLSQDAAAAVTAPDAQHEVSIASSSATISGHRAGHVAGRAGYTSQSLLRQRLSQDARRSATSCSRSLVSIASSSATISGHFDANPYLSHLIESQSLLRQRLSQDAAETTTTTSGNGLLGLNRFFVSDYLRTTSPPSPKRAEVFKSQSLLRQRLSQDKWFPRRARRP